MNFSIAAFLIRRLAIISYPNDWSALRCCAVAELKGIAEDKRYRNLETVMRVMVVAEDRRFYIHKGFDFRAMLRAALSFFRKGPVQGGSTITQQLVRTLISDYRRKIGRKYKEILLSALFDYEFSKKDQMRLYLKVAYFGWRMNGIFQACSRLGISLPVSLDDACEVISRLKYPEPQYPSLDLQKKISLRALYLKTVLGNIPN